MNVVNSICLIALVLASGCTSSIKEKVGQSLPENYYLEIAIQAMTESPATCRLLDDSWEEGDEEMRGFLESREFAIRDHVVESNEGETLHTYYLVPNDKSGLVVLTVFVVDGQCDDIDVGWVVT
ncbi:hypothetical protein [Arenimonas sp. MALMAid1274]|uniref:hypothetical protein n=1 Tax=Arenimonas sp. MALMAid1274 TaxID=3411630 RepID=UPI003BA23A01